MERHPANTFSGGTATDSRARPEHRFALEVVTLTGRAAAVELRLYPDLVEIWHHELPAAVFDRAVLRHWLAEPGPDLVTDRVTLSLDRLVDVRGRVAISLPDVQAWTLSPTELQTLRRQL